MPRKHPFTDVYTQLVSIMRPFAAQLMCTRDDGQEFYLNTNHIMKNGKPLFFGAVQIRKNYVSYHLMPVYVFPDLLNGISPDLERRMQGKSCFNFKQANSALFDELAGLTARGLDRYREAGYV